MDKGEAIDAVSDNGYAYTTFPDNLREDRDVAMATVSHMGFMLYDMGLFQGDKKIVMTAVINDGTAIQFASPELQEDKELAMAAVRNNGAALNFLPAFKREPELIKLAINHGYVPTEEQLAIVEQHVMIEREQSSMALYKSDAGIDQVDRVVNADLTERYAREDTPSTFGKLNNQGPNISRKIRNNIGSFLSSDRGIYPSRDRNKGGKRRKRTKRR